MSKTPVPAESHDKWAILRDLTDARDSFEVSNRDLSVLSALLSFYPDKELADDHRLIVFPSNAALSQRVHGMAESTLRRHLATLVRSGLILRHDSPNGKRYARRDGRGQIDCAFGFNLRPLLVRLPEIRAQAEAARKTALQQRQLRERVVLKMRDARKLLSWLQQSLDLPHPALEQRLLDIQRQLRRKLTLPALQVLAKETHDLTEEINTILPPETRNTSGNDSQNERHYQNTRTELKESESAKKEDPVKSDHDQNLPLSLIVKAAPEICSYRPDGVSSWRDLIDAAETIRPMLGISADVWHEARANMGAASAAVTIACIVQRFESIRQPGGYLRNLSQKAAQGLFSVGPMVMALLRVGDMGQA